MPKTHPAVTLTPKTFSDLTQRERVRLCLPAAAVIVADGVDVIDSCSEPLLANRIEDVMGITLPAMDSENGNYIRFLDSLEAAYALGVAVGLHQRLEAYTGGVR